jgi:predicted phage terminase large subunit-like protein
MARKRRVSFWDCAEKPGLTNDYSVCATWDETETGYYLVDLWVKKVAFPELESAARALSAQLAPNCIVIEDKSAGTQLIQNLKAKTNLPIIPYHPGQRDKQVRAAGAQPSVEAGNCYLPIGRPWVELFISRHEKFPNDEHDDEVDTTSMMIEYFRSSGVGPRIRFL